MNLTIFASRVFLVKILVVHFEIVHNIFFSESASCKFKLNKKNVDVAYELRQKSVLSYDPYGPASAFFA